MLSSSPLSSSSPFRAAVAALVIGAKYRGSDAAPNPSIIINAARLFRTMLYIGLLLIRHRL
jgi:hypothetical protein